MKKYSINFYVLFIAIFTIKSSLFGLFEEHKGIEAYKVGDFAKAQESFAGLLPNDSANSQLLFNLGDVAYRTENYAQARAYFNAAAENSGISSAELILKEQALFNAGNSYVKENEFEKALEQYAKILENNPEHERALHNKKVVEELLKQQKQEQEKQDQDKEDKQDEQDKDKKDQSEQDKKDSEKDSGKKKPEGGDQDSKDQEQKNQDQQGNKKNDQQKDKQQQQQEANQEKDNASENGGKENQGDQDKSGQQQQGDSQKGQKQGSTPEQKEQQQAASKGMQESKSAQEKQEPLQAGLVENEEAPEDLKDPVNQLFKFVESEDEKASKRLFKSIINQGMPRNHGQKNW